MMAVSISVVFICQFPISVASIPSFLVNTIHVWANQKFPNWIESPLLDHSPNPNHHLRWVRPKRSPFFPAIDVSWYEAPTVDNTGHSFGGEFTSWCFAAVRTLVIIPRYQDGKLGSSSCNWGYNPLTNPRVFTCIALRFHYIQMIIHDQQILSTVFQV